MSTSLEALPMASPTLPPARGLVLFGRQLLEGTAACLLAGIIFLLVAGVISRYVFALTAVWIDEVTSIAFMWLAMLGSAIAVYRNEHLRLTLFLRFIPSRLRPFVDALAPLTVAALLLALAIPAYDYTIAEWAIKSPVMNVPNGLRTAAIPAGFAIMFFVIVGHSLRVSGVRQSMNAIAAIACIALALYLVSPKLAALGDVNVLLFLVGLVILCLVGGVPIAFCFGVGTVCYLAFATTYPVEVMLGRMDEGMSSMILVSVPIFVFLGCILDATGMGKAIVEFLASLIGHVKAGMSYVLLGSLFIVSGISGSKVSDMATIAPALFPEMKRRGHKPRDMIALLATGAAMADTVPPSIVLIVLGSVAGISIAGLFNSGVVVAMVLLLALAIMARWKARNESLDSAARPSLTIIRKTLLVALPALVLPFLIRFVVGEGIATATEISTVAVLYALVIGALLYGGISFSKIYGMLIESAALTGAILLILGTALAMSWIIVQSDIARELAIAMKTLPGGWIGFMAVSMLVFLFLGCVLEGLPALLLLAPIMFPIARTLGINDVHYAMVIVTAMNIGLMTPPIGVGFYVACRMGSVSPDDAMGAIWPYIAALFAGLLAIAYIPAISTFVL